MKLRLSKKLLEEIKQSLCFPPCWRLFCFLKKKYQSSPPQNKPKLSLPGRLARLLLLCQNLLGTYVCWVLSLYYRPGKPPLCPLWHCRNAEGPIDVRPPSVCCGSQKGAILVIWLENILWIGHWERKWSQDTMRDEMRTCQLWCYLSMGWATGGPLCLQSQVNSGSPFRS